MKEKSKIEEIATVTGWIKNIRKLGKISFIIIKSEVEEIQAVIKNKESIEKANEELNTGDLIKVNGFIKDKQKKNESEDQKKEILVENWEIINKTANLPFEIKDEIDLKEDTRYRYRYLDLRRDKSKKILLMKHEMMHYIRNFFYSEKFIEVETPILSQNSPEGAKTFVVPSNLKDKYYTLSQSPQIFKQLLMIGGIGKYYQISKNFRNEDARSNRQIEFLQLDLEMSFPSKKYIFKLIEKMIKGFLTKKIKTQENLIKFEEITFDECFSFYGSDKPDLRNPLKINSFFSNKEWKFLFFSDEDKIEMESLIKFIEKEALDVLIINKKNEKLETLYGQITAKSKQFITENHRNGWYIISKEDSHSWSTTKLGKIRSYFDDYFIAKENKDSEFHFLWIKDWPLFEFNKEENKIVSFRHPFTTPKQEHIEKIFEKDNNLLDIRTESWDLVCNGEELASGSMRIYKRNLQEKVFQILGFNKEEVKEHFEYFLKALDFAAPPHGGLAIGIERMLAVFLNLKNLKETIAFPKNIDGTCSLTGAPNYIKITNLN